MVLGFPQTAEAAGRFDFSWSAGYINAFPPRQLVQHDADAIYTAALPGQYFLYVPPATWPWLRRQPAVWLATPSLRHDLLPVA